MSFASSIFLALTVFHLGEALLSLEVFDVAKSVLSSFKDIGVYIPVSKNHTHGLAKPRYVKRSYQKYGEIYRLSLQLENILKQESGHRLNAPKEAVTDTQKGMGYLNPMLFSQLGPDLSAELAGEQMVCVCLIFS